MLLAKIEDGEAVIFPATVDQLRADNPEVDILLPAEPAGLDLSDYGYVLVEPMPVDRAGPVETYAVLVGDTWKQGWRSLPESEEAVAERIAVRAAELLPQIDREAGAFRTRFITSVPGQATTYQAKAAEAAAYPGAPGASYPFLEAEAAATGRSVAEVAAEVAATAAQWTMLGAAIEGARIGAKRAVAAARDAGDFSAMEIAATVDWEGLLG